MADPASAAAPAPTPSASNNAIGPAPTERGWGKLFLALAAFILLPKIPQIAALLPVEQTMVLFVPALAACALVGWWAGGRAFLAIAWVALALIMSMPGPVTMSQASNTVGDELTHRNRAFLTTLDSVIKANPDSWQEM